MEELSLIILNYNSYKDTIVCVKQLLKFQCDFHIIIVDNCSSDGSVNILTKEFKEVKNISMLMLDKNEGYSTGNNYGIKYAVKTFKSKYVGILNPDVFISEVCVFEKILKVLENKEEFAVVGASVIDRNGFYNPNNSGWNLPTNLELVVNHFLLNKRKLKAVYWEIIEDKLAKIDCVAGCFFIARVTALESVGFLDENVFLYNEENILGVKLKNMGYKEGILLDQFYHHNHKQRNSVTVSFREKVLTTKNTYLSRMYLCKMAYRKEIIPFLFFAEILNRLYLALCYIGNKLKMLKH